MILVNLSNKKLFNIAMVLLVGALIYTLLAVMTGVVPHYFFFNNDSLFLPTLFRSLFVDGDGLGTWKLPDAPFFFPDFAIYSIFRIILGSYKTANMLTSFVLFGLIFIVLYGVYDLLIPKKKHLQRSLLLTGIALLITLISNGTFFIHTITFLIPVFHEGEILIVALLLLLILHIFRKEKRWHLIMFGVLLVLITASDMSIVKDFTAPIAASLLLLLILKKEYLVKISKIGITTILSTIIGKILATNIVPYYKNIKVVKDIYKENAANIGRDISGFFRSDTYSITLGTETYTVPNYMWLFVCFFIIVIALLVICFIKELKRARESNEFRVIGSFIITSFIGAQLALNFIATIFFGYYKGYIHMRYFATQLVFPIIWSLFYIGWKFSNREKLLRAITISTTAITAFFLILSFVKIPPKKIDSYFKYKPPYYECIENLYKEHKVSNGLADIWHTTPISLELNKDLRLHQVTANKKYIAPFHWLSSVNWFTDVKHDFVLLDRLDDKQIKNTFGDPKEVIPCENSSIFIYDADEMYEATRWEADAKYFHRKFSGKQDTIEIVAKDFDKLIFDKNTFEKQETKVKTLENGGISSMNTEGIITQGPSLSLEKGMYEIKFTYSSTENDNGFLEITSTPPKGKAKYIFQNTQGKPTEITIQAEVGKGLNLRDFNSYNVGVLRLITYYSGNGELTIYKMTIRKTD